MDFERDFKGVWIPSHIYLDNELTPTEKFVFVEIDSLDNGSGCYASNEYLANFCQCTDRTISRAIKKLCDKGLISVDNPKSGKRLLYTNIDKMSEGHRQNVLVHRQNVGVKVDKMSININNTENNSREINSIIKETQKESDKTAQEVIDFFNEHRGEMPKVQKMTAQRLSAIKARLQDGTLDEIKQVVLLAERSAFLQGKKAQWQATFDWLMKPSNFVKVLEGNYNKDECEKPHEKSETDKAIDAIFGGGE